MNPDYPNFKKLLCTNKYEDALYILARMFPPGKDSLVKADILWKFDYCLNEIEGYIEWDKKRWIYASLNILSQVFSYLTEHQVRRILEDLRKDNLIITEMLFSKLFPAHGGSNRTLYYTLNYHLIAEKLDSFSSEYWENDWKVCLLNNNRKLKEMLEEYKRHERMGFFNGIF